MGSGVGASAAVALTAGGSGGSMTESVSYDAGALSGLAGTNRRPGGAAGVRLSVSGLDFGAIRCRRGGREAVAGDQCRDMAVLRGDGDGPFVRAAEGMRSALCVL
jgi:hypothetical protein